MMSKLLEPELVKNLIEEENKIALSDVYKSVQSELFEVISSSKINFDELVSTYSLTRENSAEKIIPKSFSLCGGPNTSTAVALR